MDRWTPILLKVITQFKFYDEKYWLKQHHIGILKGNRELLQPNDRYYVVLELHFASINSCVI